MVKTLQVFQTKAEFPFSNPLLIGLYISLLGLSIFLNTLTYYKTSGKKKIEHSIWLNASGVRIYISYYINNRHNSTIQ